MLAAAYVRKSNEEGALKDPSLKSVARQLDGARAFAKSKGWVLDDRYVFQDDAVSGAEFNKRPGLTKLRAALASGPRFKVLIVSEQSRLGREVARTLSLIQEVEDADVEIWSYLSGRRISAEDIQTLVGSWSDSQERQKTVDRIRDAQQARVLQGRSPGWHAYGYKQVCAECRGDLAVRKTERVEEKTGKVRTTRLYICKEHPMAQSTKAIDPAQARVVKRIFKLRAEGSGLFAICRALEADTALNPSGEKTWHNQTVSDILHNEVYTGIRRWRETMQVRKRGSSKTVQTPERVIVDDKNRDKLRIIPDDLWRRAQEVNELQTKKSLHDSQGKLTGRVKGTASKHLLSPILGCAACGGAMHARRVGKKMYMMCTNRHLYKRCPGGARQVPMEDAEKEILEQFEEALVGSQVIEMFKTRLDKARATAEDPDDLRRQIKRLETEKRRLAEAIADGITDSSVKALLAEKSARLEALDGRLKGAKTVEAFDWAEFVEKAEEVQQHWLASLRKSPIAAQGVMRRLLPDGQRIKAKWDAKAGRWVFLAPPLDYDKVLGDTGLVAFTRHVIDTLRSDAITSSKQRPRRWPPWPRRWA